MTDTTAGDPDRQTQAAKLSEHERYRLLSDERRRVAAAVLADQSSPVTLAELATAISDREGTRGGEPQRRLEVRLHHVHLPMLADAGVVDYDPEANRVDPRLPALENLVE